MRSIVLASFLKYFQIIGFHWILVEIQDDDLLRIYTETH